MPKDRYKIAIKRWMKRYNLVLKQPFDHKYISNKSKTIPFKSKTED